MERAASEFLRALRGKRSQRALARRLGYIANPITDWENGRRYPTAVEAFRVAWLTGADVPKGRFDLVPWMAAVRGTIPIRHLARQAGVSRFAMGRWLNGTSQPRVPDFFRFVDAATARLPDFVAALVPIESVPTLADRYQTMRAARSLAFDMPWTEAVLRVLDTTSYQALPSHREGHIAARLKIPVAVERKCLRLLQEARLIRLEKGLWRQQAPLSVATGGDPDKLSSLLRHWTAIGYQHISERTPRDLFAYNVMSASQADLNRIRELLKRTFRQVQSTVAASEPAEEVALLQFTLIDFGE